MTGWTILHRLRPYTRVFCGVGLDHHLSILPLFGFRENKYKQIEIAKEQFSDVSFEVGKSSVHVLDHKIAFQNFQNTMPIHNN